MAMMIKILMAIMNKLQLNASKKMKMGFALNMRIVRNSFLEL